MNVTYKLCLLFKHILQATLLIQLSFLILFDFVRVAEGDDSLQCLILAIKGGKYPSALKINYFLKFNCLTISLYLGKSFFAK